MDTLLDHHAGPGAAEPASLTFREAASGLFGSMSLACWIFLLVPQVIENYRNGSAEAISLAFLFVWFLGDVTNLIGAAWARLVPVVVAIAVYYCIADGVLISQCIYYNLRNARRQRRRSSTATETPDPTTPLLGRQTNGNDAVNGSRRRSFASQRDGQHQRASQAEDSIAKIVEEGELGRRAWVKNLLNVLSICAIGAVGWLIAWQMGMWTPAPRGHGGGTNKAAGAQAMGYFSAACYLSARLPQIYKNYREKSCEGLSLLFFILSLTGNLTYGAGILFHSTERDYVLTNLPWLIGSLGTMAEDVTIFAQFRIYSGDRKRSGAAATV